MSREMRRITDWGIRSSAFPGFQGTSQKINQAEELLDFLERGAKGRPMVDLEGRNNQNDRGETRLKEAFLFA